MANGTITIIPDNNTAVGFIRPAHGRDDILFLPSALVDVTLKRLHSGDHVTFTVSHDLRGVGPTASNVRVVKA